MARYSLVARGLRNAVEQTPQRDALLTMVDSFTFAELEPRVAGLARRLLNELEVGPGTATPVLPIRVDRSTESVLAVMACAYAEIPFVSIEAATPPDRVAKLLESIESPHCLLDAAADSASFVSDDIHILRLGGEVTSGDIIGEPFRLETPEPPDLALIILTSGTTGVPKGVMYDWPMLQEWMPRRHSHPGGDYATTRSGAFSPLSSAVGVLNVLEIFVGYTVITLDPTSSTMAHLVRRLAETQPTKLIVTVQLARLFSQFPNRENVRLPTVVALNVGGEVCRYEYVQPLATLFTGNPNVLHGLSSSESLRHVQFRFDLNDAPTTGQIPLGRPDPTVRARLESLEGNPDHFELSVAGPLALGYYANPEMTESTFSIDDEGNRRWRTGDIVSVTEDGLLMHEGRIDDLVKVSGHLVSTLGVERAIQSLPGVVIATVLLKKASARTWLEAHVELAADTPLTAAEARAQLEAVLPQYMIPTTFVRHAAMPVTARGKVDRDVMRLAPGLPW